MKSYSSLLITAVLIQLVMNYYPIADGVLVETVTIKTYKIESISHPDKCMTVHINLVNNLYVIRIENLQDNDLGFHYHSKHMKCIRFKSYTNCEILGVRLTIAPNDNSLQLAWKKIDETYMTMDLKFCNNIDVSDINEFEQYLNWIAN
jgi:hypothetical protein